MLGFLPGFAYLGLLPEALDTSDGSTTPRVRVPAGLGGDRRTPQTGVYPARSPGGWQPHRPHRAAPLRSRAPIRPP